MDITVEILTRTAADQKYTQLVAPTVLKMTRDTLEWTPPFPAGAHTHDMLLRVQTLFGHVRIDVGTRIDGNNAHLPAYIFDDEGTKIGVLPLPWPRLLNFSAPFPGHNKEFAFQPRLSFLFSRVGVTP